MEDSIGDYFQPDFYHFNEDSIHLSKTVLKDFSENQISLKAIDLCCGCGVIGFEVMNKDNFITFDFNDIQKEFLPYIKKNADNFKIEAPTIFIDDVLNLDISSYDIITFNPPYFAKENSRLSSNEKRNTCRFFDNEFIDKLMEKLVLEMKEDATIYMVFPELKSPFQNRGVYSSRIVQSYRRD